MLFKCIHVLSLTTLAFCAIRSEEKLIQFLTEYATKCQTDELEHWSYRGKNAAKFWCKTYPMCIGKEQSPVDIDTREVVPDYRLSKLFMNNYDVPLSKAIVENNGHTIQITPQDDVQRTIYVGGSIYKLLQMHFHWGEKPYEGSEHTLNGVHMSLELHFVHMNRQKKLAVVGVMFQEQRIKNSELQTIVKSLSKVKYQGYKTELAGKLNLNNLLPQNPSSFYRYKGSLTTPGCAEGVTWSVLTNLLPVSQEQMAEFRKLYTTAEPQAYYQCKLSNNYRPVQPLNNRKVYISQ